LDQTLLPARNKVAGPFAPNQEPASFVMTVMSADAYWQLPRKPPGK
jgi:hypothetical protein